MSSFQIIEYLFITLIVVIQLYVFFKTLKLIRLFRSIFDEEATVWVADISGADIAGKHPATILRELELGTQDEQEAEPEGASFELHLILAPGSEHAVQKRILLSLNTYLIKNRGAVSDFHLIKDIVERNAATVEDEIGHSLSVPLYLGLLGTMLGVVFGLLNIPSMGTAMADNAGEGIDTLLAGVKIAMIASFTGLLLTVLHSGYFFKRGKAIAESRKNEFYTFIQTELLPTLNQNINSTLYSLQTSLFRFNDSFSGNLDRLDGVMGKNHDALIAQEKMLDALKAIDIREFAIANVKILRELRSVTERFEVFGNYMGSLNGLIRHTSECTTKIAGLMERTNQFGAVGEKILEMFTLNQRLQEFLQHHYSELERSQQVFDEKLTDVNDILVGSLDQLKTFTQHKIIEIQQLSVKELELLEEKYPEKWKKLDYLEHLGPIDSTLNNLQVNTTSEAETLRKDLQTVEQQLAQMSLQLQAIEYNGRNGLSQSVRRALRRMFRKNQNAGTTHEK